MRIRLNERWLEREPAPDPGEVKEYRDAQTPGLYVRHIGPPAQKDESEADRKARAVMTFMWRRTADGKRWLKNLGRRGPVFDLDAAQFAANKWNVRLTEGTIEEEAARRKNIPTLDECGEAFEKEKEPHISELSLKGYTWMREELFGDLGKKKITNISRDDLVELHAEIGATRKRTANRVLNLISRLWERAADEGQVKGRNPATGIQRFPERPRERVVEVDEWPRLFAAMDNYIPGEGRNAIQALDIQDLLRVLIYTGCRKSNALSMAWEDIDLKNTTWTIPKDKAKGGRRCITIPLVEPVVLILQRRPQSGPFVFPGPGKTGHMADPRKAWVAIRIEAKVKDLTMHDLRRSFASMAYNRGAQSTIISDALGHSNVQSTESYMWSSNDAVRREVEETAREIEKAAQHST